MIGARRSSDVYEMRKFRGLNERTCLNQKPIIQLGEKVEKGQVIADGAATFQGELALGRNVLAGFMSYDGFNFEDAIVISEELVQNDVYTSLHIEEFDVEIRETKLGREEFTRDIPNVSEKALRNLDETGIVRIGTYVKPGDVLVGKVSPKSKTELTPEEKLLHAIFGRAGEDVKNDSLEVPSGIEGIVIETQKFSRRMSLTEDERKAFEKDLRHAETEGNQAIAKAFGALIEEMEKVVGRVLTDEDRPEIPFPHLSPCLVSVRMPIRRRSSVGRSPPIDTMTKSFSSSTAFPAASSRTRSRSIALTSDSRCTFTRFAPAAASRSSRFRSLIRGKTARR